MHGADIILQTSTVNDVTDIEDLCTLCEPLSSLNVTSYPMKVERKKPREELDVVCVAEWRSEDQRWFLLVRRPEGGTSSVTFLLPDAKHPIARSLGWIVRISHVTQRLDANEGVRAHQDMLDTLIQDSAYASTIR
jgi:hypothetical protein